MNLIGNLKMRSKIFVILSFPIAGLLYFAGEGIVERVRTANEMKTLKTLMKLSENTGSLIHELQKERGMTGVYIGSKGAKLTSELPLQRSQTDRRMADLKDVVSNLTAGGNLDAELEKLLNSANGNLGRLSEIRGAASSLNISALDAAKYYTDTNRSLVEVISGVSNLSKNIEMSGYVSAYVGLLQEKERSGIERALLSGIFGMNKFEGDGLFRLVKTIEAQGIYHQIFQTFARQEQKDFYGKKMQGQAVDEAVRLRSIALSKSEKGDFGIDPAHWFNTMTDKINLMKEVEDKLAKDVLSKADQLERDAHRELLSFVAIAGIMVFMAILVSYLITSRIVRSLNLAVETCSKLASGDLTIRIEADSTDEIGHLLRAMREMIDRLSGAVGEILTSSNTLSSASHELSATAAEIAAGTEHQTHQTSHIASAVEEMSTTVSVVAQNSQSASSAAREATEIAQNGGTVIGRTIEGIKKISTTVKESSVTIEKLGKSSDQIGEIVIVIDEIADQTNLLALNAAIEAARAGENGRGFAVVADEVRKLAERTTKATKEIASMIKNIQKETAEAVKTMEVGIREVGEGISLSNQADESLRQITAAIVKVNDMIMQIAAATKQQSAAATQISSSVEGVASITKETAAGSQHTSAASQELSMMAVELQKIVGQFRI